MVLRQLRFKYMKDKVIASIRALQSFYERQATKLVILYSLVVGILATFYFYSNNLITVLVDQNAHLNISRQVIDSLTPGVSQFGSWPPFTQIIMIPFVWNNFLWHSGLAGSIPVLICFIITTIFIYKSVFFLSKSHLASIISILLFSLNPNILELAVSPLMEMPFFMFSVLTFYYVCRWLKEERVIYLFASALFSTMAALTRFDGFIFPFVITVIIILKYLFLRKGMRHLEATLIVFLFLGLFGIALNLAYNTVFLGDALAFARGNWSAYAQQHLEGSFLPSEHNIKNTFIYYGQVVIDNIGLPLGIISLLSLLSLFITSAVKRNINYLSLFILFATPAFYLLSLYQGSAVIYVKELPPYIITNTRYGTSFVLFSSIVPALIWGILLKERIFNKLFLKQIISSILIILVIFYGVNMLTTKSIDQNNYEFLYYGERDKAFFESVDALKNNYDGGKILITRSISDVFVNSIDTNISNLIQESNFIYWQKALEKPWLYARYIVMFNPGIGGWAKERDEISKKWFGKEEIYAFYNVVLNNNRYTILKINEDKIREYAWENNLNIKELPSTNTSLIKWNPKEQEQRMGLVQANTVEDLTPKLILLLTWNSYKEKYITVQGQVITNDLERPTTSEGQSYALLRAVMMNDRGTFQKVLDWTEKNLRVNETQEASKSAAAKDSKNEGLKKHLFSWLWGKKSNGDYGIKDAGNATDADEDIALALLFAYKEWGNLDYLNQAKIIINDVWEYETIDVKGKRYVVAGDWAGKKGNKVYTINPSYLAPYAYRIFAEVDTQHDWNGLVDTSYEILNKCSESTFDFSRSANIPPDWCALDKNGKVVQADNISDKSTDYSYDAIRTLWRVALDYQWNKEPKALSYLQQMGLWQKEWSKQQKIYASYSHDGTPLQNTESLAHYGTQLALFAIINPDVADQIYKQKVLSQWGKDGYWGDKNNYYDQNWAWFGTALYTDNLPNLWVGN